MRAYLRDTTDEEFRQRYDGVGAGTTGTRRVVVERDTPEKTAQSASKAPAGQRFSRAETARTQPQVDRLKQQARDATRNVRIENTDSSAVTGRQSTDQEFSDSYAKAGLQPTGLVGDNSANTTRKKYEQPDQVTRRVQKEYRKQAKEANKPARSKLIRIKKKKKRGSLVGNVLARMRVTGVNTWVTSWGLWWWACLQVPLAILLLVALGLAGAVSALTGDITKDGDTGLLAALGKLYESARDLLLDIGLMVLGALGVDTSIFDPGTWVSMTYMLSFLFGVIALFSMYLIYLFSRINSVSGNGAAMKQGALMIALCGYALPVANLLPWFLVWAIAVWFYPK